MDFDAAFSTNPPRMPITALRDRTITPLEVVQLAAASARADAFTYGEPFDLLAAELDRVAEKIQDAAAGELVEALRAIVAVPTERTLLLDAEARAMYEIAKRTLEEIERRG